MHQQLAWYVGGPLLGLCVVALRWLLNERLGATAAWSDAIARVSSREERLSVHGWLLLGLIFGGVVFGIFGAGLDGYGWLTDTFSAPVRRARAGALGRADRLRRQAGRRLHVGQRAERATRCSRPRASSPPATFFGTAIAVSFLIEALL